MEERDQVHVEQHGEGDVHVEQPATDKEAGQDEQQQGDEGNDSES